LVLLYNSFILFFQIGIRIAGIWNAKAKDWLRGRKNIWEKLQALPKDASIIWVHASSAGEFEQAKPLIENLKKTYPAYKILITFFSPSGYKISGNYNAADFKFYLPVDTASNAKRFIELVNPRLVVFVKYDFWFHYLYTLHSKRMPLLLISAVFREDQAFFKWYGKFYKKMLHFFLQIFVQDESSLTLLQKKGIHNCHLSGDTRFDRVAAIASQSMEIPFIKEFISESKVIVAGSTWPGDEELLKKLILSSQIKLLIAPHEIDVDNIERIKKEFKGAVLYSALRNTEEYSNATVLIIDNVGMLSRLYYYATITYVGGGFTKDGIHNILEAAVHARPVLFGPNYKKYREAAELKEQGGGFSINTADDLKNITEMLLTNHEYYEQTCKRSIDYINSKRGATNKIMNYIQENRLLTN
jgi:3-deoxy-D-manno-octulosonic-acid transferase